MFAHLNPHSSDFGDIYALYSPFLHQLTMQSSLFEPWALLLCPSYSRRRDRINLGLLRSSYKREGGYKKEHCGESSRGVGGGGKAWLWSHMFTRFTEGPPPRALKPPCARTALWFRGRILAQLFFPGYWVFHGSGGCRTAPPCNPPPIFTFLSESVDCTLLSSPFSAGALCQS